MDNPERPPDGEGIRNTPSSEPRLQQPNRINEGNNWVATPSHTRTSHTDSSAMPGWAALLWGPLLCGLLAAGASSKTASTDMLVWVPGGLTVGLLIGGLVWLCDRPSGRGEALDVTDQGTFIGRVLAVLSALLFCLPYVGLVLAVGSVLANWRRRAGWPWLVSRIAFVLTALLSAWVSVMIYLDKSRK